MLRNFSFFSIFLISLNVHAFITVGTDAACDMNNIATANLDGDADIRVTNQIVRTERFTIDASKTITGGFDSCFDAENFIQSQTRTKWEGNNLGITLDLGILAGNPITVTLNGFEFFNGNSVPAQTSDAGFINVIGATNVFMLNTEFHDNSGKKGGAIQLTDAGASLALITTNIHNNSANNLGGGIYCENGKVTIYSGSAIHHNLGAVGGGIYANNCQVILRSGEILNEFLTTKGIYFNTSNGVGGGIAMFSGSHLTLEGTLIHPAAIKGNRATMGGGIYADGDNTTVEAYNAQINGNFANSGGGIYITENANFTMYRLNGSCWDDDHCSEISENQVTDANAKGGAVVFDEPSTGSISQTLFKNNLAPSAAAIYIKTATLRLEGNIFTHNSQQTGPFASTELFKIVGGGTNFTFLYNTVNYNEVNSIFALAANENITVANSILWNAATDILTISGNPNLGSVIFNCNTVNEDTSLQNTINNHNHIIADVNSLFIDNQTNNYHLKANSGAIDRCDESILQSQRNDFNDKPRGVDNVSDFNIFFIYDAGAYEYNDIIFKHGFE